MNVFVDTSFLVALAIREDSHHLKAKKIIKKFSNCIFYIDDLIKYESANVLLHKSTIEKTKKLNKILSLDIYHKIPINNLVWDSALNKITSNKYSKSGPNIFDYIHFACMTEYDITDVLTFNNHFSHFGFNILN